MSTEEKSRFPAALVAGVVVVGLVVGTLYILTRPTSVREGARAYTEPRLPMGNAEKLYAERIHISDVQLSRATNMLNQEFTYVSGIFVNNGTRVIRDVTLVVEFRDQFEQVVLRETQRPFGSRSRAGDPLPAGQRRAFQLTFEHVPADWNRKYPDVRVNGLVLD